MPSMSKSLLHVLAHNLDIVFVVNFEDASFSDGLILCGVVEVEGVGVLQGVSASLALLDEEGLVADGVVDVGEDIDGLLQVVELGELQLLVGLDGVHLAR